MAAFPKKQPDIHAHRLEVGLYTCEQLLAEHMAVVARTYGNGGLGLIDLPPLPTSSLVVPAQVESAAVLYWCSELEKSGILPLVETLAEGLYLGKFNLPIQHAGQLLRPFWRTAEHRFTKQERMLLYRQVLDNQTEGHLDRQLLHLCLALSEISRAPINQGILNLQTRAAHLANQLTRELSDRGVGISAFAGRDIVRQIRLAFSVLQNEEIQTALGGGSIAIIIRRWAPALLGFTPDVSRHLSLASDGVAIIKWLAQTGQSILTQAGTLARTHPILNRAESWLANHSYPAPSNYTVH